MELDEPSLVVLNLRSVGIFAGCAVYIGRHGRSRRTLGRLALAVFTAGVFVPLGAIGGAITVARKRHDEGSCEHVVPVWAPASPTSADR